MCRMMCPYDLSPILVLPGKMIRRKLQNVSCKMIENKQKALLSYL
jgi:hypothetical protein